MHLIPYFLHRVSAEKSQFQMWILWAFLPQGGTHVWQTDEESPSQEFVVQEYLEPNGFHGQVRSFSSSLCLYEIDPAKTKFSDFFLWPDFLSQSKEIPPTCDIWRPFFWIGTRELGSTDEWCWKEETESLMLTPFGPVSALWETIRHATSAAI